MTLLQHLEAILKILHQPNITPLDQKEAISHCKQARKRAKFIDLQPTQIVTASTPEEWRGKYKPENTSL